MSTVKVSVTLDATVLVEAKQLVGERGLSRFLNEILAQRLQQQRLLTLLAEMESEHGPIPDEAWAEARADAATWPR